MGILIPNRTAEMTIPRVLEEAAKHRQAPALSFFHDGIFQRRYTYRELGENVAIVAGNLLRLQVRPKDRVVVLSNNSPDMFFFLLATMALGAIVAPVNPLESPRVLKHIMTTLRPRLVVVGSGFTHRFTASEIRCPWIALDELYIDSTAFDFSNSDVAPDDTAVVLFTSGTTSEPKGVCLSHFNLLTNARGLYKIHHLAENPVHMCVLPLFHANAFGFSLVASLCAGSHVVLCNGLPGYAVWSIIAREAVNIISVVPQMLQLLGARAPGRPPAESLRYFVSAAAPLSKAIASQFIATTGAKIHQGYGLSECVNFATTIPWDIASSAYEEVMFGAKVPSIGTPLEGCNVFVRSLQGAEPAPPGGEGELVVTGDTLMSGYWENEEASRNAIIDDGLRTGDLGFYRVLNGQRFFFITGRIKEIIIRHGEKISPLAVEADLQRLHAFGRFAVAGFENAAAGEEIGLYLQVADGADRSGIAQVVNDCAALHRPRLVLIGDQEIPTTATGKVKREELARRFCLFSSHAFGKDPVLIAEAASGAQLRGRMQSMR